MILKTDFTWIIALCTFIPIFILAIVAVVIRIVKTAKLAKNYNKNTKVNEELKTILLQAFGEDNIVAVESEMSRLTITVKDIDLVNADVLKENGCVREGRKQQHTNCKMKSIWYLGVLCKTKCN